MNTTAKSEIKTMTEQDNKKIKLALKIARKLLLVKNENGYLVKLIESDKNKFYVMALFQQNNITKLINITKQEANLIRELRTDNENKELGENR